MRHIRTRREVAGAENATTPARFEQIEMERIAEPKLPARETMDSDKLAELAESMALIGLQQPIIVEETSVGYRIVAGHRRYLAARAIHWQRIPALVYAEDTVDTAAVMLHENVIREDLNAAQEAVWFQQLIEQHKLDEAGICALVKRNTAYVSDRLTLLRNDSKVFDACRCGDISFAVARALNRFPDVTMRRYYLDCAVRSGTSARVVNNWLQDYLAQVQPPLKESPVESIAPVTSDSSDAVRVECFLCGGTKDPWNLVAVYIHKFELAHVQRMLDVRLEQERQSAGDAGEATPKPNGGIHGD